MMTKEVITSNCVIFDYQNFVKRYIDFNDPDLEWDKIASIFQEKIEPRLEQICRKYKPMLVYMTNDLNGSGYVKTLYENYKANRVRDEITERNEEIFQPVLTNLIKTFPFIYMEFDGIEGDYLSYLIKIELLKKEINIERFVYTTCDSDMFQVLDDKTIIFDLSKDEIDTNNYNEKMKLVKGFNYLNSFTTAKALVGDTADNIPGIYLLGWKTIDKIFNALYGEENPKKSLNELINDMKKYLKENGEEIKLIRKWLDKIVEEKEKLLLNEKIINFEMYDTSKVLEKYIEKELIQKVQFNELEYHNIIKSGKKSLTFYKYKTAMNKGKYNYWKELEKRINDFISEIGDNKGW